MNTVPAREIKRRGISAVDECLQSGPVHVIKNDEPTYVIMDEDFFQELIDVYEEATIAQVKAALEDVAAGRVRKVTPESLIEEFGLTE